jgi:hypothetical protein
MCCRCVLDGTTRRGTVTALMFVLTIGPVDRFRRSKQVVSYLGLNPRESSSGGRQRLGAISKQGNSMARFLLIEAAQTASRYDEELRRDYQRLKFRRGNAVAKVAIARKLAVRLSISHLFDLSTTTMIHVSNSPHLLCRQGEAGRPIRMTMDSSPPGNSPGYPACEPATLGWAAFAASNT